MRATLRAAIGASVHSGAHPGLYYERYAPLVLSGADTGKISKEARAAFLERVVEIRVPDFYPQCLIRWQAAFAGRAATAVVQATSRILVGHGNAAPSEVGISLHPVYGVPYLPGSGLKGLLNHYLASFGATIDGWQGVSYEGARPVGPPGNWHKLLFGCPNLPAAGGEALGAAGGVAFEDALLIPEPDHSTPLALDVLTPHQLSYYRDFGADDPNDWTDPIPVTFATVRPGARFLLAVSYAGDDSRLAVLALAHLLDALRLWGVGSKTRAGYGRLERVAGNAGLALAGGAGAAAHAPALEMTPALVALQQAVARVLNPEDPAAPPVAARLDQELSDQVLDELTDNEKPAARVLLRDLLGHRGLKNKRGKRLDAIRAKVVS